MERPQRACASRMHRPQDVTNEGSGRSDSDSSWDVDSADTSSSSASVGDSGLSDTSRSRTSEFDSWESFHAYLDLNQKETYQVLRMHSTKSIASDHDKKCDSWDARGRSMHASKW
ncbi:hypothetical protein PC117_g18559 [Phytophthora cactorum]|uniref:Uncharacterized protein n=1 Tax=Phytophthora cactorum TaxID=29920 RepID=A0A8T1C1U3_9STRA|nr:hypothetical protein PC117_g18559 [Phytophthora cactorum]